MTNGDAIRAGFVPCETNPATGGLSRTPDTFHGQATKTVGSRRGWQRHVCEDCFSRHHQNTEWQPGLVWE